MSPRAVDLSKLMASVMITRSSHPLGTSSATSFLTRTLFIKKKRMVLLVSIRSSYLRMKKLKWTMRMRLNSKLSL